MTASDRTSKASKLLLQHDNLILILFALYGLSAGLLVYVSSLSYDSQLDGIAFVMDFPVVLTLFWVEWFAANPGGFSILNGDIGRVTIVVGSVIVWTLIGLLILGIIRLFKLGS